MSDNKGFRFNREISVGDVLVVIGAVATIITLWHNLDTRVTRLEAWREFARPSVAVVTEGNVTARKQN